LLQALATTRVVIVPNEGGPNDEAGKATDAQTGLMKNRKFSGAGSDTDIITSSARAYISAINKMLSWTMRCNNKAAQDVEEEESSNIGDAQLVDSPPPVTVN
jgi:2-isopropylmalate synthase